MTEDVARGILRRFVGHYKDLVQFENSVVFNETHMDDNPNRLDYLLTKEIVENTRALLDLQITFRTRMIEDV